MCQGLALLAVLVAGCTGDARRPSSGSPGAGPRMLAREAGAPLGPAPAPPANGPLAIIPRPRSAVACSGSLVVDRATPIVIDDEPAVVAVGARLADWLDVPRSNVRAIPAGDPGPAHAIVIRLDGPRATSERDPTVEPPRELEDESYTLDITPERALLRARHPAGLFYGAQSLAQLALSRPLLSAPPALLAARARKLLPCVRVDDAPASRVRAMHLDVARHFFSRDLVERYVDILSFYRFNVFHWHLTDDQGFRLAIRSHPELTQIGGKRIEDGREYAGSYTQDEARAVVAFAKDRFVTVIPEIEMPGHARAILAAHPELSCTGKKQEVPSTWGIFDDILCAGNDRTFALIEDILREATEVFPSKLVHVGGDEVPKKRWNECPKCRARMKNEHLDAEQLQGAFMKKAGALLAANGRRMLAWDEALEGGLAKDGVVVAWQGEERGAAAAIAGHDVVMAPHESVYFNFWQSRSRNEPGHEGYLPWTKVLAFDPRPAGIDDALAAHVLGGEGALWTEYVRTPADLDALLVPRVAALSESLWGPQPADAASFVARFTIQRPMLDASGIRYFVEPPSGLRARKVLVDEAMLTLVTPSLHPDGVIRFTLDGSDPEPSSAVYTQPIAIRTSLSVATRLYLPGGRASDVVRGKFERTALRPGIQPSMEPDMLRPGVLYKYFEGDFHKLPDVAKLAALRTGRLGGLSFDPAFRAERFGVIYEAWIVVPADGVYRFVTHADDGVTVDIDGVRVVDDDGEHPARDADGEIALERGPHTVRVAYFQGGGGKQLELACEGPGLALGPCALKSP